MLSLAKKEYQFYMKVWSMLQSMVGDDIFNRIDELSIMESDTGVFNTTIGVYKPRREYAELYNATIDPQSLEFIRENISKCDC
ncbi:MAG: hypothetical protein IKL53_06100, partial [Lachnospiraceae bacterium]|nr:hypothetical protein [Lachnospiraceae bacterium]